MFCSSFFPLFYLHTVVWIRFIFNTKTPLNWIISHTNILGILCASENCKNKIVSNRFLFSALDFQNDDFTFERSEKKFKRVNHLFFIISAPVPFFLDIISSESSGNGNSIWIVLSIIPFRSYLNGHSITLFAHLYKRQQIETVSILSEALCYTSDGVTVNI